MSIEQENVSLDDLNYFWMPNGAPCFMADREDICEIVESLGFQIYYLIANLEEEKTVDGKDAQNKPIKYTVSEFTGSLLKVVNNMVGRSIAIAEEPFPSDQFAAVKTEAYYSLPKIPYSLIEKLDEFFRVVDAQHGTESIVILTFDPNVDDSSGWGVLVPEQSNTSVHCKYDADSIAFLKPDHVMIVGSVHSHPGMAAYASGTDHADQADFDGIHITFGWQKTVNNGATQYYAEMQLSGNAYKLDIDDVIEFSNVKKDPDPEVVEWTTKVKKALPPSQHLGTGVQYRTGTAVPTQQDQQTNRRPNPTTTTTGSRPQTIPFDFDPTQGVLIAEVDFSAKSPTCPSCDYILFEDDAEEDGSCPACDIMIASASWSLGQIEASATAYLDRSNQDSSCAFYLWCKDDTSSFLIQVKADELDSRPDQNGTRIPLDYTDEQEWEGGLSLFKDDNLGLMFYTPDITICCMVDAAKAWVDCTCPETVYFEDINSFDTATRDMELYSPSTSCVDCAYNSNPECPAYRQAIIEFVTDKTLPASESIIPCDSWVDFNYIASAIDSYNYSESRAYYD